MNNKKIMNITNANKRHKKYNAKVVGNCQEIRARIGNTLLKVRILDRFLFLNGQQNGTCYRTNSRK